MPERTDPENVYIDVRVTQITLESSDRKVEVKANLYGDGWHVAGTPSYLVWEHQDEALAVASYMVRELHKAKRLDADAEAIRQAAIEHVTARGAIDTTEPAR